MSLGVKAVECGFSVAFFRLEELLHAMRKDAEVPPTRLKGKKYMKAGPGDHRRGGLRDLHAARRRTCSSGW